jgi:hypothetical protein
LCPRSALCRHGPQSLFSTSRRASSPGGNDRFTLNISGQSLQTSRRRDFFDALYTRQRKVFRSPSRIHQGGREKPNACKGQGGGRFKGPDESGIACPGGWHAMSGAPWRQGKISSAQRSREDSADVFAPLSQLLADVFPSHSSFEIVSSLSHRMDLVEVPKGLSSSGRFG